MGEMGDEDGGDGGQNAERPAPGTGRAFRRRGALGQERAWPAGVHHHQPSHEARGAEAEASSGSSNEISVGVGERFIE